jgi:hypothetical protein
LSDIAIGAVLGYFAGHFYHRKRIFFASWTIWAILIALNAEYITVKGANLNASFLHLALAREFVEGSVFSLKSAVSVIFCLFVPLPLALFLYKKRFYGKKFGIAIMVSAIALTFALPSSLTYPHWRQSNLVEDNLRLLINRPDKLFTDKPLSYEITNKYYSKDLSGVPILRMHHKKRNVLLILVEGITYEQVELGLMKNLNELSHSTLSASNFITLQHFTNRGVYAAICGDYPNFLIKETKSDIMGAYGTRRQCLPSVLSDSGYHTVFMQSALIRYTRKDLFAARAGFDEWMGEKSYDSNYQRGGWGVSDETLYSLAFNKIKELDSRGQPWFLTLLTSSTHHPLYVPGDISPTDEEAAIYADKSLGLLLAKIKEQGVLENTLVIITSDEAAFTYGNPSADIMSNHGPLIVIAPEILGPVVQDNIYTQADIALSIVDYLGIDLDDVYGRSVFRTYTSPRDLIWGSSLLSRIYALSKDSKLYVCSQSLACQAYGVKRTDIFNIPDVRTDVDSEYITQIKAFLAYNELSFKELNTSTIFREKDTWYTGTAILLGDNHIEVDPHDKLAWRFKLKPEGLVQVAIDIEVYDFENSPHRTLDDARGYRNPKKIIAHKRKFIGKGESFDFNYEYDFTEQEWVWTTIRVGALRGTRYYVEEVSLERR